MSEHEQSQFVEASKRDEQRYRREYDKIADWFDKDYENFIEKIHQARERRSRSIKDPSKANTELVAIEVPKKPM